MPRLTKIAQLIGRGTAEGGSTFILGTTGPTEGEAVGQPVNSLYLFMQSNQGPYWVMDDVTEFPQWVSGRIAGLTWGDPQLIIGTNYFFQSQVYSLFPTFTQLKKENTSFELKVIGKKLMADGGDLIFTGTARMVFNGTPAGTGGAIFTFDRSTLDVLSDGALRPGAVFPSFWDVQRGTDDGFVSLLEQVPKFTPTPIWCELEEQGDTFEAFEVTATSVTATRTVTLALRVNFRSIETGFQRVIFGTDKDGDDMFWRVLSVSRVDEDMAILGLQRSDERDVA